MNRIVIALIAIIAVQGVSAQEKEFKANPYQRSILIIGAGHVLSMREMLKEVYPELKVKLMCDE